MEELDVEEEDEEEGGPCEGRPAGGAGFPSFFDQFPSHAVAQETQAPLAGTGEAVSQATMPSHSLEPMAGMEESGGMMMPAGMEIDLPAQPPPCAYREGEGPACHAAGARPPA